MAEYGTPLSIGEARGVAKQIRGAKHVDPGYWPWVIEELCDRLEGFHLLYGDPHARKPEGVISGHSAIARVE